MELEHPLEEYLEEIQMIAYSLKSDRLTEIVDEIQNMIDERLI